MDDFATLPGGIYLGGKDANFVDADAQITDSFDNFIFTFGGRDTVLAGQGNDIVSLSKGNDFADGGSGNDVILGGQGRDTVLGGTGNDGVYGEDGDDRLDGGAGDDIVSGGRGHDLVGGGDGNDLVLGGDGHDTVIGGAGNDTVIGGAGHDQLAGGSGRDAFVFESGFGRDVVLDFQKGVDTLQIQANINGLRIRQPEDLARFVTGDAASAEIKLGSDSIKLVGVSRADLIGNLSDYVRIV
jgi:Ca2+-binding RTX toxin-like protein